MGDCNLCSHASVRVRRCCDLCSVPLKKSVIGMDETSGDKCEQPRAWPNSPENCDNVRKLYGMGIN